MYVKEYIRMRYKLLIFTIMFLMILTSGCFIPERFVYHPEINQGNYFSNNDFEKIKKGMTQQEVISILGTPMLKELFGQNIWYYIFRQQPSHGEVKQKTLILIFDHNNFLIDIKNNS